jgi:hypothetical protein
MTYTLSVPERHQLKVARDTLKMSDAMARVMGGPTKAEARKIIRDLTGATPRENPRQQKKNPGKLEVAETILHQLGGRRFIAMTGAKSLVGSPDALQFRIGKADRGINSVRVVLTVQDDYRMEFYRYRAGTLTLIEARDGIYHDQLAIAFTQATGLTTSLGTMGD